MKSKSLLIAHRGASADAKENTLEAFKLAFVQGADGIEADFLLTTDRKIIAFHDLNTQRLLGTQSRTKCLNLSEIRKLSSYHIPELKEVLACLPKGKKLIIELKCGRQIEQELMQILRASQIPIENVTVISFRLPTLIRLRELCPKIEILWIRKFRMSQGIRKPNLIEIKKIIEKYNFDGISANASHIDQEFIQTFKQGKINCWTVDSPKRFQELTELACHSISSNCPGLIREQLKDLK
ncbi:glycerophosphodiester phosphodiesterase family protein [Lentisphaera profundi]|uniref:Glycerophosphodiester phosphodiesterase family protein n=1 Tax=Lentisphaera profundi TaxID=1658616 RepID=A0ABY7VXD6_9BACT|nr:glycerophosphodiester phosphodiesterase family protein [Lentisphaera profundi]WDE97389.1 glycerophosphodiester phosphodiesterase family protein [Lentisphaera profundi]